jgi:hypothetical protein
MPYDDGSNSARARSAQIRASHDYEATHLEEMRRRSASPAPRRTRAPLLTRLSAVIARRHADAGELDVTARPSHAE